ncbi:MAG: hypothetical protein MPL62_00665 [Alphaproteobacteria bacterium]|nr:hypothetical protein [Alphaproteobacteria bacterium]
MTDRRRRGAGAAVIAVVDNVNGQVTDRRRRGVIVVVNVDIDVDGGGACGFIAVFPAALP